MNKEWKIKEKISEEFLEKYPDYNQVILQLLYNRGIVETADMKCFLDGSYEDNFDPFLFVDMEKAIELIIKHLKEKSKVCIYGDYDADGITSSALLYDVFKMFKADVSVYIPDRVKEGYGVNKGAVDKIKEDGVKLIITVDTGVRSREEIDYAKENGIDVLLTDHHPAGDVSDDLPNCLIINPALDREEYPFKKLAGVGVAFKLAQGLIKKSTLKEEHKQLLEERLLDLVAVGTVADMVSLLGENRILVKRGLAVMNNTRRIGLKELIKVSVLEGKKLKEWNIGFQIAPRLNASSRIDSAGDAFNLLVTKDLENARSLSIGLSNKNKERQELTKEMTEAVIIQAEKQGDSKIIVGVCPEGSCWKDGIVGLVAGRIAERYYKPTLVITRSEDGFKGSGRSVAEFDLAEAIDDAGEFLGKHGGHPMACAFSLSAENLEKFVEKVNSIASDRLVDTVLQPKIDVDLGLCLKEVNIGLVESVMELAPFGRDNPEPIFLSDSVRVCDLMTMGLSSQHIKFKLDGFWAIAFGKADMFKDIRIGDMVDVVYNLDINKFNGNQSVQLKIIDLKLSK